MMEFVSVEKVEFSIRTSSKAPDFGISNSMVRVTTLAPQNTMKQKKDLETGIDSFLILFY